MDGADLAVAEELRLDGDPGVTCRSVIGGDNFSKFVSKGPEDPRFDQTIHPDPI